MDNLLYQVFPDVILAFAFAGGTTSAASLQFHPLFITILQVVSPEQGMLINYLEFLRDIPVKFMDLANMEGGIVIGTGDLSEAALGWATYNGDSMSMYNVNCSIPKTLVRKLVEWKAENDTNEKVRATLHDIVATPVSPELLPADEKGEIAQKTEDLVGPYELHDFLLYHFIRRGASPRKLLFLAEQAFADRYPREVILHWMEVFFRRFFSQQFKRSAMPDGAKVGTVSLSPRGDWMMPSDAVAQLWLDECDNL